MGGKQPNLAAGASAARASPKVAAARLMDLARAVRSLGRARPEDAASRTHGLRVAARRASVTLSALRPCLRKRPREDARLIVRALRRAAGDVRDCDVHSGLLLAAGASALNGLARAVERSLARIAEERTAALAVLRDALERHDARRLQQVAVRLGRVPRDLGRDRRVEDLASRTIGRLLERAVVAAHADLSVTPNLHELRLGIKRLRYAVEVFRGVYGAILGEGILPLLQEAQQRFGEVNDVSTLSARLRRYAGEAAGPSQEGMAREYGALADSFGRVERLRAERVVRWWAQEGARVLEPSRWPLGVLADRGRAVNSEDSIPDVNGGAAPDVQEPIVMIKSPVIPKEAAPAVAPTTQANLWLAGRRLGVIDIGSNSIRLLVVELVDERTWKPLGEERAMTRLAQGLAASGQLSAEAMARAVEAIGRFKAIAESLGAHSVRAFATAAVREARNRNDFISLVQDRTGLKLELVSAREEGKLTHRSVARVVDLSHGTAAVVDIGGGSLEVVFSQDGIITGNTSMPLGAVRLTEAFGGADACAGPRFREMKRFAKRQIRRHVRETEVPPTILVGCGGAFTTLQTLAAAGRGVLIDRNSPALTTLGPVPRTQVRSLLKTLRGLSLEERLRVPGLPSDRADIIVAGLAVIDRLMAHLGASQLHVHPGGFREGLLMRMIDEQILEQRRAGLDASDGGHLDAVRAFAARCRYDKPHSEHVARLATRLYDQFRGESTLIRGLGTARDERLLLEAGAVLHDIGIVVEYPRHHKHGMTMIRHADIPGLTSRQTEILALLARYHRRTGPRPSHRAFADLPEPDRALVRRLAAILRIADGLDRQHAQLTTDAHVRFGAKAVTIEVESSGDATADVAAAKRKADVLTELLPVRLRFSVNPGAPDAPRPGA